MPSCHRAGLQIPHLAPTLPSEGMEMFSAANTAVGRVRMATFTALLGMVSLLSLVALPSAQVLLAGSRRLPLLLTHGPVARAARGNLPSR